MQKTDFDYEILIHDDASTDGTAGIIREYELRYPEIIKPIYQIENQYSKGIKPTFKYNFPRARGKYIALCEGDDYWTDPYKLQKQVDFLEENEGYVACFHKSKIVDKQGQNINQKEYTFAHINSTYKTPELIERHIIPTASLIFRNSLNNFTHIYLLKCKMILQGDIFLELILSTQGDFYFFNEYMATYRIHPKGISKSKRNETGGLTSYLNLLDEFDKYTVGVYCHHIQLKKQSLLREQINQNNNFMTRYNIWLIHRKMIKDISFKQERELIYKYLIPRFYKYLKSY